MMNHWLISTGHHHKSS